MKRVAWPSPNHEGKEEKKEGKEAACIGKVLPSERTTGPHTTGVGWPSLLPVTIKLMTHNQCCPKRVSHRRRRHSGVYIYILLPKGDRKDAIVSEGVASRRQWTIVHFPAECSGISRMGVSPKVDMNVLLPQNAYHDRDGPPAQKCCRG